MIVLVASARSEAALAAEALLREKKYTVCRLYSARELSDRADSGDYSLAIVFSDLYPEDPMAPVYLLHSLENPGPVFFISEAPPEDALHVLAMEAGAEDGVTLPVSRREFLVRTARLVSHAPAPEGRPCWQGLSLDREKNRLHYNGESVPLTNKQTLLLSLLLERPGEPREQQVLLRKLWPGEEAAEARLFTNVSGLRSALKSLGCPLSIRSLRGKGYVLDNRNS